MIVAVYFVLPIRYSKVVPTGNLLMLQLEMTPSRQQYYTVYGKALKDDIALLQQMLASETPSRIEFIRRMAAGEDPAKVRSDLLSGSGQTTPIALSVIIPVTNVSSLYQ